MSIELGFALYKGLYLARRCEEYIVRHYPDDEMKTPMHMSMGQEAIPVGICHALAGKADILATYRSHAPFLAQTGDHGRFFAELHGRVTGTADGKSGSMHLSAPEAGMLGATAIVGSNISVAVGAAFANERLGTGRTVVAFFGDGAVDEGTFWESINVASLFRLPLLFVCEDNDYAVHTPKSLRRGYASLTAIVRGFDCLVYEDESNDVETIYFLTREAIAAARERRCPVFFNLKCCRYLDHIGIAPDGDACYREPDDVQSWRARDCVATQRARLIRRGLSEEILADHEQATDRAIEISIAQALAASVPAPDRLYRGVFHETS